MLRTPLKHAFVALCLGAIAACSTVETAHAEGPLIDPEDTLFLMVDHQTGLLQSVGDIPQTELRANVSALAQAATYFGIPTIATSSVPTGPNGPLIPEIEAGAPSLTYIPRDGEINAWDNTAFKEAVEASGKKTLVISGVLTSVCVAFPALSALEEGYTVYAVIDASGDYSEMASRATMEQLAADGVHVTTTFAVLSQIHKKWTPENAQRMSEIYRFVSPGYGAVMESYYAPRQ